MATLSTDKTGSASPTDLVMEIPVELTVELGSTELPLREVMHLAPGSIIELDKKADEPVSLYVNRKLVARGEVVVVENNFGIKVTSVVGGDQANEGEKAASP
ncbi:MAG: flagellar motor switch protein FliN [Verrucomicrobia bacterium]|nr:flagellar motor switch protein FliN [Verrucomicrobiota bacterium]